MQLFIPEAQATANMTSKKKLKWALKYNPDLVSYDEGNMQIIVGGAQTHSGHNTGPGSAGYDLEEALVFACKYGRKVRIARW
jgi:hypothetical protein